MLHIEGIKKLDEIKTLFAVEAKGAETVLDVCERFFISTVTRRIDMLKRQGYYPSDVIKVLLYLPFLGVATIRGLYQSGCAHLSEADKNVYYRLKNNSEIDWRTLLFAFAKRFRKLVEQRGATDDQIKPARCFIVDDTTYPKTGMRLEFIGKVHDHVLNRWVLGFKSLAVCFWDGKSILPLDFSLHCEKGRNQKRPFGLTRRQLKQRYHKERAKQSPGAKRATELLANKSTQAIKMIRRSIKHGFVADYVLADCWFITHPFLAAIRAIRKGILHVIGPCRMDKRTYLLEGSRYTAKELLNKFKGHKKRSRKVRALYIEQLVEYKGLPVKLFFVRYAGQKKWKLLLTTDLTLNFNKAIEIYTHRWTIEVMFKEAKQHLNLGKGQANDFDSQLADTTISLMQYIALTLHKRFAAYETLGELFRANKQYFLEATLAKRLWAFFLQLIRCIAELFEVDVEELLRKTFNQKEVEYRIFKMLGQNPLYQTTQ